jgi:hypothetical protein
MAVRLARILLDNGHHVTLGSRTPSRTPSRAENFRRALDARRCAAGTYQDAASQSFVLPAVFVRDGLFELMEQLRPHLVDKTLIDIANPFNNDYTAFVLPCDTSASEEMQRRFPECRVVGAFKNVSWETFEIRISRRAWAHA